jgi:hypothetical protein
MSLVETEPANTTSTLWLHPTASKHRHKCNRKYKREFKRTVCACCHAQAMEWLLKRGASTADLQGSGSGSVSVAAASGMIGSTAFHHAAAGGSKDAMRWLVDHGADPMVPIVI